MGARRGEKRKSWDTKQQSKAIEVKDSIACVCGERATERVRRKEAKASARNRRFITAGPLHAASVAQESSAAEQHPPFGRGGEVRCRGRGGEYVDARAESTRARISVIVTNPRSDLSGFRSRMRRRRHRPSQQRTGYTGTSRDAPKDEEKGSIGSARLRRDCRGSLSAIRTLTLRLCSSAAHPLHLYLLLSVSSGTFLNS